MCIHLDLLPTFSILSFGAGVFSLMAQNGCWNSCATVGGYLWRRLILGLHNGGDCPDSRIGDLVQIIERDWPTTLIHIAVTRKYLSSLFVGADGEDVIVATRTMPPLAW
ncbi:hypothetical protein H4582DRAFT_1313106 [Lactarius indigo]|nr:hypothetical protein H4582DRAFT_1313106 [Lactarius indigo]